MSRGLPNLPKACRKRRCRTDPLKDVADLLRKDGWHVFDSDHPHRKRAVAPFERQFNFQEDDSAMTAVLQDGSREVSSCQIKYERGPSAGFLQLIYFVAYPRGQGHGKAAILQLAAAAAAVGLTLGVFTGSSKLVPFFDPANGRYERLTASQIPHTWDVKQWLVIRSMQPPASAALPAAPAKKQKMFSQQPASAPDSAPIALAPPSVPFPSEDNVLAQGAPPKPFAEGVAADRTRPKPVRVLRRLSDIELENTCEEDIARRQDAWNKIEFEDANAARENADMAVMDEAEEDSSDESDSSASSSSTNATATRKKATVANKITAWKAEMCQLEEKSNQFMSNKIVGGDQPLDSEANDGPLHEYQQMRNQIKTLQAKIDDTERVPRTRECQEQERLKQDQQKIQLDNEICKLTKYIHQHAGKAPYEVQQAIESKNQAVQAEKRALQIVQQAYEATCTLDGNLTAHQKRRRRCEHAAAKQRAGHAEHNRQLATRRVFRAWRAEAQADHDMRQAHARLASKQQQRRTLGE